MTNKPETRGKPLSLTERAGLRETLGVNCPRCPSNRNPTILIPQQRCKVDGYIDPRPMLVDKEFRQAVFDGRRRLRYGPKTKVGDGPFAKLNYLALKGPSHDQ